MNHARKDITAEIVRAHWMGEAWSLQNCGEVLMEGIIGSDQGRKYRSVHHDGQHHDTDLQREAPGFDLGKETPRPQVRRRDFYRHLRPG